MKKRAYVAGAISGNPDFIRHFKVAELKLKAEGYIVFNPAELPAGLTQDEYMRICLDMIDMCDMIYMLNNWHGSKGANVEFTMANYKNLEIRYEPDEISG